MSGRGALTAQSSLRELWVWVILKNDEIVNLIFDDVQSAKLSRQILLMSKTFLGVAKLLKKYREYIIDENEEIV
jgi:hypothetical protein